MTPKRRVVVVRLSIVQYLHIIEQVGIPHENPASYGPVKLV